MPVLHDIKEIVDANIDAVPEKTVLGRALHYCRNQWQKLLAYTTDGRLSIDNGASERAIKPFVIGRKNWLFCNSVQGAEAGQVIYSLIETCAKHAVEPYAYFRFILNKIPNINDPPEYESLLPYNIDKSLLV